MMNALTAIYLIILPVTAAYHGAPWCSRCQFAHSPADRCCLECESCINHSQEAAIRSYVSKQLLETQQCRHRTPVLSLKRRFKSAFVLSSKTSDWIESPDLHLGGCKWCTWILKYLSLLSNDPSAGMTVCLTGSLLLILSSSPQTGESTSFTQASKTPFFPPSLMTLLPRRSCLFLWIPTKQASDAIVASHMSMVFSQESDTCATIYSRKQERIHTCLQSNPH